MPTAPRPLALRAAASTSARKWSSRLIPTSGSGRGESQITGPRSARLISKKDAPTGVQLIRDFALAEHSTHLRVTQTIKNVSDREKHWGHWSRTFGTGGGIVLIPLTPASRFPASYVMYGPGPVINYRPEDPNIRIRDNFLEILSTPLNPKLGMDSQAGWFAYLDRNDLLWVKPLSRVPPTAPTANWPG